MLDGHNRSRDEKRTHDLRLHEDFHGEPFGSAEIRLSELVNPTSRRSAGRRLPIEISLLQV